MATLGYGCGSRINRLCSKFIANDGLKQQADWLVGADLAPITRRVYHSAMLSIPDIDLTSSGMIRLSSQTSYTLQVKETHLTATSADATSVQSNIIQTLGRWSSDCYGDI